MPGATDMISKVLHEEKAYRLLSGVAHGHSWAIAQLSFNSAEADSSPDDEPGVKKLEKGLDADRIGYLAVRAMMALSQPKDLSQRRIGPEDNLHGHSRSLAKMDHADPSLEGGAEPHRDPLRRTHADVSKSRSNAD